jgi:hypothetical protein
MCFPKESLGLHGEESATTGGRTDYRGLSVM